MYLGKEIYEEQKSKQKKIRQKQYQMKRQRTHKIIDLLRHQDIMIIDK